MSSGGHRSTSGHRAPRAARPDKAAVPRNRSGGKRRRLPMPSLARALRLTALSAFVPGTGHLAAGRRYAGWLMFGSFVTLLVAGGVLATAVPHSKLVHIAVEPGALELVMAGGAALALIWVLVVFSSWVVTRPAQLRTTQKIVGSVVVLTLSLGVAAPFAFGVRTAYVQRDLLTSVFPAAPPKVLAIGAAGRPVVQVPVSPLGDSGHVLDGKSRVNVLLLGGDGGKDRTGVRTDTMILASIDAATGRTVLISLPRNMEKAQFPPGSAAAAAYPNGFTDLLNSVYTHAEDNPRLAPGALHPGAELIKQTFAYTIGQDVDYFVLVNLSGFRKLVDAFGGVTINVTTRLPIGGATDASGRTTEAPLSYLEPGRRKLDGYEALWYGRSRYGSDDYQRMSRQRCLLGAIAKQANPLKVLKNFKALAAAAKEIILTDIPQEALPELLDLAANAKSAKVTSVTFVRSAQFKPENPDFAFIQSRVAEALLESEMPETAPTPAVTPTPIPVTGKKTKAGKGKAVVTSTPTPAPAEGTATPLDDVCSY
jgi:LCP family protein required for cell wall assembly